MMVEEVILTLNVSTYHKSEFLNVFAHSDWLLKLGMEYAYSSSEKVSASCEVLPIYQKIK